MASIYMFVIYTTAYKLYTHSNTHRTKNSKNRVHMDFNSSYLVNKTEIYRQANDKTGNSGQLGLSKAANGYLSNRKRSELLKV